MKLEEGRMKQEEPVEPEEQKNKTNKSDKKDKDDMEEGNGEDSEMQKEGGHWLELQVSQYA